eukprot:TRINITY_DN1879_c0_g1_i11.p1 TRINITY_DN1879_c0_g1~~TRINITY_DN1879_c0_g1_i11.p1  ORF type:complete len:371 (-),score=65.39 TRINITY_DN1879_c0_g1_i11:584-1696(-)
MKTWSPTQTLGDIFLKMVPFLRMYSIYTANYEASGTLYEELLERGGAFADFAACVSASNLKCKGALLNSFLILPVQRIPRYKLLLEDMLNHTVPSHSDHKLLEEALVTIKAVANEINEAIKDQEKRKNLLAIQRRIGQQLPFNLVEPHRSFVREGELWKVCRKTKKRRYFFLFTDLLLYGEETSTGFKHHLHIGMQTLHVSDLPDSDGLKNSFAIESSRKSFVVIADAPEGKSGWLTDISKRIEEFIINKNSFHTNRTGTATPTFQAPVWQTDGEVVKCNICSDEFSLINRRHHCRLCGLVVCHTCSSQQIYIAALQEKLRVCAHCYSQQQGAQAATPSSRLRRCQSATTATHCIITRTREIRKAGDGCV